ncbi:hypothetical protein SAMN05660330_01284 [Desulforhopalus singaporensis]|uniref:Uncharacterized protein n=1 Tax=Desulforhopalus singaporensis TaxID=91360 RepID=A0A1H0N7L2_9BACT|nr:hypothetical protein SAMN05660330_01284 [Desulforhopalus singaporensis]
MENRIILTRLYYRTNASPVVICDGTSHRVILWQCLAAYPVKLPIEVGKMIFYTDQQQPGAEVIGILCKILFGFLSDLFGFFNLFANRFTLPHNRIYLYIERIF